MKNYPAPPFTEAYIIQLPQIVKDDKALNWTDRIAYWFFVHHKGDSDKVITEMELSPRRFREIKQRLASRGHIARIEEKNQIKYIAVDCDSAYLIRIDKFRKTSITGFQKVGDQNIFALKLYHTYAHILHVMEVLEWTYRTGKEKIKSPHSLLKRSCKTGVTPAAGFIPGFWERELDEKEAKTKKTALQEYREAKAAESEAMKALNFERYFKALPKEKQEQLEKEALDKIIEEQGPFMSYVSKRMEHYIVMNKIMEIMEERHAATGSA